MKNNALKNDVTKNESASERAAALVLEAVDVLWRVERGPRFAGERVPDGGDET